ncbi:MAG: chorismate mutase [Oscillospiraceae bacterium]|jgi:chorismate mutase/prephenate dehydratase|nr:chorismate mutase [Oscillospiraceae bacterium]
MTPKEELQALRGEVDIVTADIVNLFKKRQKLATDIARVKSSGNLAVTDLAREQIVVESAVAGIEAEYRAEAAALTRTLISLSKLRQYESLELTAGIDFPASAAPPDGAVAYQGVPGAWSEHAASRLFPSRELTACEYFDDVFNSVQTGRAAFGVVPIENSRTGAIGEVYDLLRRHACYITGQMWISVAQCLLGVRGASIADVREVFSHPEGLSQCKRFLKNRSWDLTDVRNTAVAAQLVAERGNAKYAAIGSRRAAEVYGLDVLQPDIADDTKNRTRFIVIAAQPIYDDTSDVISVTFSTAHRSGALVDTLQAFSLANLNLTRIESRPVSRDKYRFFVDLTGNIADANARDALRQAAAQSDYFEVLGCYRESEENA